MTRFHVVGGTYVDEVYWVESEIDHDVSLTASSREHTTGGPGACLALALARLGTRVRLTTALGDGEDTAAAVGLLEREGVAVSGARHPGPLDRSVTLVTPSLESVTVTHRSLPPLEARPPSLDAVDADTVVCSPTRLSSLGHPPRGRRLVLLPHLPQCHELLGMDPARVRALLSATHVLVANEREHRLLEGLPGLDGIPVVAVTRGGRGSTLYTRGETLQQAALTDPGGVPRNPNGAGEAFAAALLVGLASGEPPRTALRAAALHAGRHVTGRASLSFPGAGATDTTLRTETEHVYG
ncbi:carbohydrate kinase family protein [Nocardiopsis dassonvillei]|uniref:carbohydrate kinase family protein n=1 Tax=Nocardiopsis dassonvillei TaxID=2014 RepID=UPI0036F67579